MKKTFLLLLCAVAATAGLKAQEFAPKSAIWHYSSTDNASSQAVDYATIQWDHDTVIHGLPWKVLRLISYTDANQPGKVQRRFIVRQDSSIVYQWIDTFSTILYNFNQKLTDTFIYTDTSSNKGVQSLSKGKVFLDSIGTISISGQNRKILYETYKPLKSIYTNSWIVIEGIGGLYGFTYDDNTEYPEISTLRCYSDSSISYLAPKPYNGWAFNWNCDSVIITTGIKLYNYPRNENWVAAPNPFTDVMYLSYKGAENNPGPVLLEVYTPTGQLVFTKKIPDNTTAEELDLATLAQGLYFLKIQNSNSQNVLKILKN